ncbi:MAG: glycosyltransferase family 4 protein [Candidatus Kerfeldbacteria bacterium]|nr:glycosyltransferase family 4 protein [Candidatus Kerfeldbacteria bacterium]
MRLVIDARLYGLEHRGLGRYLVELIRVLSEIDHQTDYILLVNPSNKTQPDNLPSNFKQVAAPWRVYSFHEQWRLPWLLLKLKPDLVHWPHFTVPLLCPAPFIVTIHDLILHSFPSERATTLPKPLYWLKVCLYHLVVARAVRRARQIITVSQAVANEIRHFYKLKGGKITVIPLAPGTLAQPVELALPANYLLVVGAAYPHKNLDRLTQAFAYVSQLLPELKFIIVGKKDIFMERLQKLVEQLKLSQAVKFWGEASEAELASLYQRATVYALPSLAEGFGLGALEALARDTVVLAADIPVLHEVLAQAALYANPYDTRELSHQLHRLITDLNLRQELKTAAAQILKSYSWQSAGTATKQVYSQAAH